MWCCRATDPSSAAPWPALGAAGLILEVSFVTKFKYLPHVQIECDLAGTGRTYRHVFQNVGCDDVDFEASVPFKSDAGDGDAGDGDVWACRRRGGVAQGRSGVSRPRCS